MPSAKDIAIALLACLCPCISTCFSNARVNGMLNWTIAQVPDHVTGSVNLRVFPPQHHHKSALGIPKHEQFPCLESVTLKTLVQVFSSPTALLKFAPLLARQAECFPDAAANADGVLISLCVNGGKRIERDLQLALPRQSCLGKEPADGPTFY